MDIAIISREAIRTQVARALLASPDEGEGAAIESVVRTSGLHEDTIREVIALADQEQVS